MEDKELTTSTVNGYVDDTYPLLTTEERQRVKLILMNSLELAKLVNGVSLKKDKLQAVSACVHSLVSTVLL